MSRYIEGLLDRSLHQPVSDFRQCAGKRIRGSLLQLSYEMAGGAGQVAAEISEAIENLHAGSLIIDDIQDDSHTRRGQPTMHRSLGVPLAINAGNWMYFNALECLSGARLPADQRWRLVEAMISAARRCHEGQAIDLDARIDTIPGVHWHETASAISTLKTGTLVALALEMGCIAADPETQLLHALSRFGRQIGIALQMRNDLEELGQLVQNQAMTGTDSSVRDDDLRHARLTWPWVWALQLYGWGACRRVMERALASEQKRRAAASELYALIGLHGDKAIRSLVREQLLLLGEHILDRRLLSAMAETLKPIEHSHCLITTTVKPYVTSNRGTVAT